MAPRPSSQFSTTSKDVNETSCALSLEVAPTAELLRGRSREIPEWRQTSDSSVDLPEIGLYVMSDARGIATTLRSQIAANTPIFRLDAHATALT